MNQSQASARRSLPARWRAWWLSKPMVIWPLALAGAFALGALCCFYALASRRIGPGEPTKPEPASHSKPEPRRQAHAHVHPPQPPADRASKLVRLSPEQQAAIGLRTEDVTLGVVPTVSSAPGRVAPNENRYAFITPRAPGVVRTVNAHVGQEVKAGDLLATVDSPDVGEARLELYTRLQHLDIASSEASWQETIYHNTTELLARLQKGETPEQLHNAFEDRALGENRERLMTAYAQFRLAQTTMDRNRDLHGQKLITKKQFEQVKADFEVAQATYFGLMDQMGYEVRLANTRAQQARRQAQTSVRAAQEHLRILGVKPDGTEPEVASGKVVGVKHDGTLVGDSSKAAAEGAPAPPILPAPKGAKEVAVEPPGAQPSAGQPAAMHPVSTYSIWAPFDGTILDREMIVPGVAVDTSHRIFTLANLSTVWVEASVHESDFDILAGSRGGRVRFRSPAYPGRVFEGRVIYSGDLVDEKSRTVKLLAEAANPDRLLKPGMFVEVEVVSSQDSAAAQVPAEAILTQGTRTFVFVRAGPEQFAMREVVADTPQGGSALVRSGLDAGEEVVVEGGSKLKAMALQAAGRGS